jgi:serine/threonine-protein kinase OSR1/STK39
MYSIIWSRCMQVWLALCKPLQTTVAVKLVELEELGKALDLLIQEAHTMMSLRHPNVLHLHCSFIHNETLWLVTPYISGGTLSQILRTQVWPSFCKKETDSCMPPGR